MVEVLDPVVEPRRSRSGIGWAVLATVVAVLLLWIASSVTVRIFEISGSTFTIPKWHLAARQLLQVGAGAAFGFVALQGRRRSKYGIMGRVFAAVIALALLGFGWQFYFGAAILKISTATIWILSVDTQTAAAIALGFLLLTIFFDLLRSPKGRHS